MRRTHHGCSVRINNTSFHSELLSNTQQTNKLCLVQSNHPWGLSADLHYKHRHIQNYDSNMADNNQQLQRWLLCLLQPFSHTGRKITVRGLMWLHDFYRHDKDGLWSTTKKKKRKKKRKQQLWWSTCWTNQTTPQTTSELIQTSGSASSFCPDAHLYPFTAT